MCRQSLALSLAVSLALSAALTGCAKKERSAMGIRAPGAPPARGVTLSVTWFQWQPAELLSTLAQDFTRETGIVVKGDYVPYPQWYDRLMTEMAAHGSTWDLIVVDSQWLGKMVTGGHLVELTDWIAKEAKNIKPSDYYEATWNAYGEYPPGSKRYYAVTCEQDALGLVYRKDLFEDPKEKEAFKKKYGYELAPPKTWNQLRDIAAFFTRPEKNLYGLATKFSREGDCVSTDWNQILWSFGGELWNPATKEVRGYVNSPTAVKALEFYKSLYKYAPPGSATYGFDQVNQAVQNGLVAMAINWYAFMPSYLDPQRSKVHDKLGFAMVPGDKQHYISLGGQGIGVCSYSKHKQEALQFIDWLQSDETQWKWVDGGGYTGKKSILNTERFAKAKPYNPALRDSLPLLKDFWNVPEYAEMLTVMQEQLNAAVAGQVPPKQALDTIAEKQHQILEKAGYYRQ